MRSACARVERLDPRANVVGKERRLIWSSEYGLMVDASESYGDEGRDKLR